MITLQQLFKTLSPKHISQQDKAQVYKLFLQKKERKNGNRRSLLYKSFAYSLSTLSVVGFILFGNFFGLFDTNPTEIYQNVDAQSIWKIISSDGIFSIYNNQNRKIDTDTIQLTDRVIVDKWSKIKVLIHDSFTAEIVWPAQFEIIIEWWNENKNYNLKFINGWDYIAINSILESQQNKISIQTRDGVTIKWNDTNESKKISFEIKNTPWKDNTTIINKSTTTLEISNTNITNSLLSKITSNGEWNTIVINPDQIVEINNEIKDELISLSVVSQQAIANELPQIKVQTTPKTQQEHIITKEEPLFNENDITQIKSNLYKTFLEKEYTDLTVYHFGGKENEYIITKNNINNRLNRLANIIKYTNNNNTSLDWIIYFSESLASKYKEIGIPWYVYKNLNIMIYKLKELNKHSFWIMKKPSKDKEINIDYIYSLVNLWQNESIYKFH